MKQSTISLNQEILRRCLGHVPSLLVGLRLLLGPIVYVLAIREGSEGWIVAGLIAAFLSDVFDGVLARRLGVVTERLRMADSWADGFYFGWIVLAVCRTEGQAVRPFAAPLCLLLIVQLGSYALDWRKYRRIACFHAYSAKAWGITLFLASVALLGFHQGGAFLGSAIIMGFVANLEGYALRFVLKERKCDVPSLFHALRSIPAD